MEYFDVYISYVDKDEPLANEIAAKLNKYCITCFLGRESTPHKDKITNLDKMKVLVLLFSKGTLDSTIIDNDITEALNNRVPIVPFQVDDTSVKENLSLDFMLKKSQWVLGFPNREKQLDNLIVSICRFLGVDLVQENPSDPFEQLKRGIALEYGTNTLYKNRKEAKLWLEKSANNNNAMAMYELYKFHVNSEDDNDYRDYHKAKEWLIKAAESGLAEAQYKLGTCYEVYDEYMEIIISSISQEISWPLGISKDLYKARKYYIAAGKQGHKRAMFRLGILCLSGPKDMLNDEYAFKLLNMSKDINDHTLWLNLGRLYEKGINGVPDYVKAVECFEKAGKGAISEIAMCYFTGRGVKQDFQKAFDIAFSSCNDFFPKIQELRAEFYLNGILTKKNIPSALNCIKKAFNIYISTSSGFYNQQAALAILDKFSEINNPEMQYLRAQCYMMMKDFRKAFYCYADVAELLPIASARLGEMLYYGIGTLKDYTLAARWLERADIPGLPTSSYLLGELYEKGEGVCKNLKKAFDCYKRAAIQNVSEAQYKLYIMYRKGRGVQRNLKLSSYWYRKVKETNPKFAELKDIIPYK